MKLQRVTFIFFLIFIWIVTTSAIVTKSSVDQKIGNLKYTDSSLLEDSIEVIVYDLYSFQKSYGLQKIKEIDKLISDENVIAKLRIKHSLAAFDEKNKYELLDSALAFSNKHNIEKFKIEYFTSKGNWYYIDQRYDSSLVAILEARNLALKMGIDREIQTSHLLGDLFFSVELFEQAEEYFKRVDTLLVNPRYDEVWRKRVIKNNLALIDMKKGNYESALKVYQESKDLVPRDLPTHKDSLAVAYYNRKIARCLYNLDRNLDEAIEVALFTNNFAKRYKLIEHLYLSYNILIRLYVKTDQPEKVQAYFDEYKAYYSSIDPIIEFQKENALLCAEVAEYFGDEKKALAYYKEFRVLDNSESIQIKSASIVKLLTNQDYLNLQNNYNIVNQQRKTLIIIFFVGLFCISLILLFAYRTYKLNRNLTESNKTKDKLFSIIAHDLRSPFNSIMGFSELSYQSIQDGDYEETKQFNLHVLEKSKELLHLIENLLNWSRTQQERLTLRPEEVTLNSICEEIKPSIELQTDHKSIKLDYKFNESHKVKVDVNTIKTVFTNILSNAIKYSHPNSSILITSSEVNSMIEVEIMDKGIGIPKAKLESLFQLKNQQSALGTNGEQGTGLGLIICKEFVEKNNGTLSVKSEEGLGTTVRVLLPKA